MRDVLLSTLVMGAVASVLAALLVLAERYLADYGVCKIDINDGAKRLEVTGSDSLLSALFSQRIFVPSACGGRGTCAYCKLKVLEGGGPALPTELPLLTDEERAASIRLSCQVKVRGDMSIRIPDELFLVKEFRGRVERIRDMTHDIKELRIGLEEPDNIQFTPGQYVQLKTPVYARNEEVYRAYSISSAPTDSHAVELIIRLVPGGICTTWVHEHLKEGDEVTFNGPYGEFRLSDSGAEMVWIAGGSGMAPFWSILRDMRDTGARRPGRYFFGAVSKRDLFLVDELRALQGELPGFEFIPALSAPDQGDAWDGETGLITEVVGRHLAGAEGIEGYLCGSAGMIGASVKVLVDKGIPEERIFFDKFN